jgi:Na+-transporting methylmalonyl-CoA/oxaloacetate decarboxylase beta subunit
MEKRKLPIIAILLILSIANYLRIEGAENIRTIEFLSIFVIGVLSGVLLVALINKFKKSN